MTTQSPDTFKAAEFFAGIGLVRLGLASSGFKVVFANDFDASKAAIYRANFGAEDFHLGDICNLHGADIPSRIDLATASFPCTDLSLAGKRAGLAGSHSGMFWEFCRIINEMGQCRPRAVMLENVPSLATSHGGKDLYQVIKALNALGYWCDILTIDARQFIPQSRLRLFVIASSDAPPPTPWPVNDFRPSWIQVFKARHPDLNIQHLPFDLPNHAQVSLSDVVERLSPRSSLWWDDERRDHFYAQLSPVNEARIQQSSASNRLMWATAFRRTRYGVTRWEIRPDSLSGCLRTARGGSSKQAVVEAGRGNWRVRWMTAREYARLQGAPDSFDFSTVSNNQALFAFGDAVCVPVISWLSRHCLKPLLSGELSTFAEVNKVG